MTTPPPVATQNDTITALLGRAKRTEVPIRKTFVQQGTARIRDPGPLAHLCSHHDERALDLYLLLHAAASADPFDVVLSSTTWARVLGLSDSVSARSSVSKAFSRLVDISLVERGTRAGNRSRMVLLDEGGHGTPYQHPAARREPYLKLPHRYWTDGWHQILSLRGKVVLLIALSLDDDFVLPIEKAPDWYSISSDTLERGLAELDGHALLAIDVRYKSAPLAPAGYTQNRHFTLNSPFGPRRQQLASVTKLKTG